MNGSIQSMHHPLSLRILIVEHSDVLRMLYRAILHLNPPAELIVETNSSEEALELIPGLRPDLVLTGLIFVGVGGPEFIGQIRQLGCQLKIVVVSGFDDPELAQEVIERGADAYCLKGMSGSELVEVIYKVQQGHTWVDPAISLTSS